MLSKINLSLLYGSVDPNKHTLAMGLQTLVVNNMLSCVLPIVKTTTRKLGSIFTVTKQPADKAKHIFF